MLLAVRGCRGDKPGTSLTEIHARSVVNSPSSVSITCSSLGGRQPALQLRV